MHWSLELLNSVAAVGTFFVILATAIAAGVELRHLQAKNQLQAQIALLQDFRSPELQEALRYVQFYLDHKMRDPQYRRELAQLGFIDARVHPEMTVCNWFNEMGTLVKYNIVEPDVFLDQFARLINAAWKNLTPVMAILRRHRGAVQYQNFEYLAALARRWVTDHPQGVYPTGAPHMEVRDVWREADTVPDATAASSAPGSQTAGG
jgi:hypothetical protein